ncbi:MAG: UDP-N-acetylmuramyl-tripeptide synthetase [Alkalibacterium sp.]|uniref:UDP-N-acetylmuramoylalanyl-D-glutamate--2,6-diaminopimelate ligase n=1 Tax=Alkalibacterium gilvum TaxID=1130080 RepID=A0A1H6TI50_9LACT|nr:MULTISPECIES: UDP-N-acetylmuramyl-tripeptide synthetase [Alkalibacterium]MDN6193989.1 UDP-N-acetylmuramyl-tripeptide synthetase [Alkalibacterium sp.]MDN6293279.1 UDP-N-acetylmuramyl-tripeptide synthetase [Alkalibacterium sp.]MDN6295041.1 UDP-N-acetylmuramyl-tripeptide synthetase [Alkalibacterium sp.]MDN6327053.1 UDP-N-acetylmuramyl-tripeptide synthetase [Alkalibacterium sp.]MDN6397540.1 UDP-N-acetylmuramyl-tripeptide synthetase [Alkalibacterium sp.]
MQLSELLEAIKILEVKNEKDVEIKTITYHSKDTEKDSLFVCIKGYQTDGHQYAQNAVDNGAIALVVEEFLPNIDVPQYKVEDSRKALAAIADKYYDHPSKEMTMIGITATNGKTSTSFMTNAILEEHKLKTGLLGTVMVKFGETLVPSVLTTPESLDLHGYFNDMRKENISHVTMEVSSSALELSRVGNVSFDIVALNNISREHIDLHGSFEEYFDAKASLIRKARPDQFAVLNLDDSFSRSLIDETDASVVTYGIEDASGHLQCKDVDLSTGRGNFTVEINKPFKTINGDTIEKTRFKVSLSVAGYHSVYNSMAAITIGLISGVDIETIQSGIERFKGVERRFQFIYENDFKIVDDHFANAGNIEVTLETLTKMDYKKLHIVYAIRGNRGVTTNRENAQTLAKWVPELGIKKVIVSLSESHVIDKDDVLPEEMAAFREEMDKVGVEIELHKEMPDALESSLDQVETGDVILIGGAQGMDFGAKYILNQLVEKRPDLNAKEVLKPLDERVAGIDETFLKNQ